MQLFITNEFEIKDNIIISEKRIINQLRKVLRAKAWYIFFLQNKKPQNNINKRYKVEVIEIKDKVIWKILEEEKFDIKNIVKKWVITAILNKFDKMELIVQKLTEIWIYEIWFVNFQRSVFKNIKDNKIERFNKILLEAAEQSGSTFLPEIKIYNNLEEIWWNKAILDFEWENYKKTNLSDIDYILIWPEWWITEEDIKKIGSSKKINLWKKVLRAETAAIVWWFILM